jgi:hypothetical protein
VQVAERREVVHQRNVPAHVALIVLIDHHRHDELPAEI